MTLGDLAALPQARVASEAEGLGWIDLHLLASAALSGWSVLTADRFMNETAKALGLH